MIGEAGDGTAGSEFGQEKPAHTIRFPEIPIVHYLFALTAAFLSRIPTGILKSLFFEQNSNCNFE